MTTMTCRAVFSVSVFSTGTRWTVRTRRHAEPCVEIYDAVLRDSAMCAAGRPAGAAAARARAGARAAPRRPRRSRPVARAASGPGRCPTPRARDEKRRTINARSFGTRYACRCGTEGSDDLAGRADGGTKPCPTDAHTRPYSGDSRNEYLATINEAAQRQPRVSASRASQRQPRVTAAAPARD